MHNKVWQKKIAVLLVIAMVLSFMPLAWANTGDTAAGGAGGSTTASSPSALQWSDDTVAVMDSTTYSSLQLAIRAVPQNGSGTITIVKDICLEEPVRVFGGRNITLVSDGDHTITFDPKDTLSSSNRSCFVIGDDNVDQFFSNFIIGNSSGSGSLTIKAVDDTSIYALIYCRKGSAFELYNGILDAKNAAVAQATVLLGESVDFTMYDGTICNGVMDDTEAGAVRIEASGIFEMKGGRITDVNGHGVVIRTQAAFRMTGGQIASCGNDGIEGGAVYFGGDGTGTFDMSGGEITGCKARSGGGVGLRQTAIFTMSGGTIKDCEAVYGGSVYARGDAQFVMTGGTICNCSATAEGAGVCLKNNAKFILNGGKISGCHITALDGAGGGIHLGETASFEMKNGEISDCGNDTIEGGGVFCSGKFDMLGGTIKNCKAKSGGVLLRGDVASFTLDGTGIIENCSSSANGGGVYVRQNSAFKMKNGIIRGCYAGNTGDGGGVFLLGTATFCLEGGKITGNGQSPDRIVTHNGGGVRLTDASNLDMRGGEITGNVAQNTGGGISISGKNAEGRILNIDAGAICENKLTNPLGYGGGIYIDKDITLQLYNTLVTGNTATALGGGIWACRTGDIKVYVTNGGAVYNNNAMADNGDKTPEQAGDDIAFVSSLLSDGSVMTLYTHMLGGGLNHYYEDGGVTWLEGDNTYGSGLGAPDGKTPRYDAAYANLYTDTENITDFIALKNVVSPMAKASAETAAKFIISGNKASRGAGIGTNGNLIIGTPDTEAETGSLTVQKEVTGTGGDTNKAFNFTVTLKPDSGAEAVNGEYGDMIFEENTATFTLKHGESKTAEKLPADIQYTVTEREANQDGYTTTPENVTGTIKNGERAEVKFINHKDKQTGNLTVSKTVSGSGASTEKDFTFTVTLDDKTLNGDYGDMTFTAGVANFTLKHEESKTATGLPAGVEYTVTESNNSGYTVTMNVDGTVKDEATGTIPADKTSVVLFNNDKGSSGGGGGGSDNTSVTVRKVWVTDDGGTAADSVKVQLLQNGSVYDTVTLNARNNWSYTWYNLSDSDTWTVEEAAVLAGFISTVSGSGTVWTITNDDVSTDTPDEPTIPEEPGTPDEPTTPEEPGTPEEPNIPSEQENPNDPEYGLDDPDVPKGGADAPEDGITSDGAPRTGDAAPTAVFAVLLLAAAGGFAITRRKRNQ